MDFSKQKNITIFSHPLIKHKISLLRDKEASTNKFRTLIEEIAMLEAYEALSDLPLKEVDVETPIEKCKAPMIDGLKLAIIPVLRAGLGMVPGLDALVPSARIGHIGMYRDEVTHKPVPYYCKLPQNLQERTCVILDPMLATGGSAVDAVDMIKEKGGKKIKFLCIIAAPEGLEKLATTHPDVQIYVGQLDRELNKDAYICPGLGDAGDRIFGTK
ncbi:uracil phosphoribosyltransferase [Succinivibrio sp.]|uniref:uracil phosphoribosyltransferase n=1 Tax=Succinivibrio sp. TaxID=2053619 RepID=UPI0025902668|nr:uracil phosphoribosyltransferase [Succinivibrio sp.]MCI6939539.1 uracil phosphoribosyltransferase [Succinatimonas hippei]MDD6205193.1 uracil phosphoribosyltransferase [Succinivibrio sp.]